MPDLHITVNYKLALPIVVVHVPVMPVVSMSFVSLLLQIAAGAEATKDSRGILVGLETTNMGLVLGLTTTVWMLIRVDPYGYL